MVESSSSKGSQSLLPDLEKQVAVFEQEIHERRNATEVGQRLSDAKLFVRKRAFEVLRRLSLRFSDTPEVIQGLLAGCNEHWPKAVLIVAKDLFDKGEKEAAGQLFEEAYAKAFQEPLDPDFLNETAETAMHFGMEERASGLTEKALALSEKDRNAALECVGLAYAYEKAGRPEEADRIWERIRSAHPNMHEAYARFKKERRRHAGKQLSSGERPTREIPVDPHFEEAKLKISEGRFLEILGPCERSFMASAGNETVSTWISTAYVIARHYRDIRTANRLWAVILKYAPQHASSFQKFSKEHNVPGADPETDRLIQRAHGICGQAVKERKRLQKQKEAGILSVTVVIDGVHLAAWQWIEQTNGLVSARNFPAAFRIWAALLENDQQYVPAISKELARMASFIPPQRILAEMRMEEMIQRIPAAGNLYRSVAANLRSSTPTVAEQIFSRLRKIVPDDPGIVLSNADFFIDQKRFEEAAGLWLPLTEDRANACARCAYELARHQQHAQARMLFREVAKLSPETLIKHGYDYFQDPTMSDLVLECIEPLLPTGEERSLEQHQVLALKLFVRHGASIQRVRTILAKLESTGGITPLAAQRVLAMPVVQAAHMQRQRDREIEGYLQKQMPGLRRSGFFRRMVQTQPLLEPGKRTDRTARSVVLHPTRLFSPDTPDPKNRRKK